MKLNQVLIALVASSGFGIAAAQEAYAIDLTPFQSTTTQAEVRAGIDAARAAGLLTSGEVTVFADNRSASQLTRAQVMAEAREAQRLGLVSGGEVSVFASPAQRDLIRMAGLRALDPKLASNL